MIQNDFADLPYFAIFCHSCCLMLSLPFVFSALIQTWGAWLEQKSAKTWSLSDFIPLDTVRLLELLDSRHSLEYFGMLLSSFALTLQSPKIGHWKSSPLWVCWSIIAYNLTSNGNAQVWALFSGEWLGVFVKTPDSGIVPSSPDIQAFGLWQLWQLWQLWESAGLFLEWCSILAS